MAETTYIRDNKGELHDLKTLGGIRVVDPDTKQVVDAVDLDGSSKKLLALAHHSMATDYSYMPTTTKDMVHSIALDMMTDGAAFGLSKILAGIAGAVVTGGNPIGAGIGIMLAEAGTEAYHWISAMDKKDDPYTFWNEFTSNLEEVAKTDYDLSRHISELGVGMSFTGMGAKESFYKNWGDVVGESQYNFTNALGMLVHSAAGVMVGKGVASGLGSTAINAETIGVIGESVLSDSLREATQTLGITDDVIDAMKVGGLHALSSGITGVSVMKGIPYVAQKFLPSAVAMYNKSGFFNAMTRGAELSAYGSAYNATVAIAEGRDEYFDLPSTATMFLLGMGLSKMSFKKPVADELANKDKAGVANALFDNTEKHYTNQQEAVIADNFYKKTLATGELGDGVETLADRIRKEYFDSKGIELAKDSAENISSRIGARNDMIADTWRNKPKQSRRPFKKPNPLEYYSSEEFISMEARKLVGEEIETMVTHGIIDSAEEANNIARSVLEIAKANTKGKRVGNFEIRQALDEFMDWNKRF
jgi:hypothetical protein